MNDYEVKTYGWGPFEVVWYPTEYWTLTVQVALFGYQVAVCLAKEWKADKTIPVEDMVAWELTTKSPDDPQPKMRHDPDPRKVLYL